MGRYTQYEEDSYLLPEGFTRIAYDADTGRYTFRDSAGQIYKAAPGEPMKRDDPSTISRHFETNKRKVRRSSDPGPPPKTFQDILPPHLISPAPSKHSRPSKFAKAVRDTGLPKMLIVVRNLRRSVIMARRRSCPVDEATERLLRRSTITSQSTRLSASTE